MTLTQRARSLWDRLIGIADDPTDDDDVRLGKHIGVVIGLIHVFLPFALPGIAQGHPASWAVVATMPPISAINLAVLARTRRFRRYVVVLILMVMTLPAFIEVALGGIGGSSANIVFAFLGPVYAILTLGPRRATLWFVFFLVILVAVILVDPLVSSRITPQPYEQRLVFYAANLAIPLGLTFMLLRYTDIRRREAQARADELLTNAIPASSARRLKSGERRIAEVFRETTVLFADLEGFTPWSQTTDPGKVVGFLDDLFTRFDTLAEHAGVEKVKTIGDAYMAVAGAPEPRADHAAAAAALARGMLTALDEARADEALPLQLRIGLASGPAVGGVIGQRRILFDLWGDTVNLASRMETSGVPGRIHVALSTREALGDTYSFEERGSIDVKGLGRMTTYLLGEPLVRPTP